MDIKKLSTDAKQSICASQVIVSIGDAVKELLENSLDAKSDKIEIRLKNFGAELIEVHDNGSGIQLNDLSEIMTGHCTSKIKGFNDLTSLNTFGFRGEALSSLCSLSNMTIHTCTDSSSVGTIVSYNCNGEITSRNSLARSRGTTTNAKQIFLRLPVRRRQLLTNLRREYDKVVYNVTSYCLVSVGAKISCYRVDGGKQLVITNNDATNIRSNIEAVFGSTQMKSLIDVNMDYNISKEIIEEYSLSDTSYIQNMKLEGCISKPTSGTGRGSSDRQFLFINGRPCDAGKISKVITTCYKDMNYSQVPVFVISIHLPSASIDVNVEPNKRMVLFDHLPHVLAVVKSSVQSSFLAYGCCSDSRSLDVSMTQSIRSFLNTSLPGPHSPTLNTISPRASRNGFASLPVSPFTSKQSEGESHKRDMCPMLTSTPKRIKTSDHVINSDGKTIDTDNNEASISKSLCSAVRAHFSLSALDQIIVDDDGVNKCQDMLYRTKLSPEDDHEAAEELRRIFKKSQFLELDVLGQFNLGFIVAKIGRDLFIVDQHASDERARFEDLLDECKLGSQPLVKPVQLRLGSGGEELVLDNMGIFEQCGFRFVCDDSGVTMTAVGCRKGLVLGVSDVLEILEVVRDTAGVKSVMPSRVKSAVASNACRGAIMVGRCLLRHEMVQVVSNMAGLRNPWVCAHGRPTMRHLCSLEQ